MAIKKTELYRSLWESCDELRGGMDASQYKDYILTLLFVKYVSDKYAGKPYAVVTVPEGGSFADMVRLKGDKEIGDKINKIIGRLAKENRLKGVIDLADFNDEDKLGRGKEMVDRLSSLVAIFEDLDLGANRAGGDDLLGDAYEYLMRNFATQSGKSKGQFYTPAEVSRVLAQVVGITPNTRQDATVYDPTCGSGSLLLKVAEEAPRGLSIYGQEMDNATAALARMNMILHDHPSAEIWRGNTLASPHWTEDDGSLKRFDFAVANPPFSYKSWRNGLNPAEDEFGRFEYGTPPAKNGDYAFLLHILKSLKSTGKAAVILPHGVLFRGHSEADIRRTLIRRGFIKGVIGLPPNLFYGTGIPAAIIVLDKEEAATRQGILMVDASRGFMKDGNKNRLRSRDIHKIVDVFTNCEEVPRYSRMVSLEEIKDHEYNLNISRYIDSSEPEDRHDLHAHLNGGIPKRDIDKLNQYWQVFPTLRRALFTDNGREGYRDVLVEGEGVREKIMTHPEFKAFSEQILSRYCAWQDAHANRLYGLGMKSDPKALIEVLAEDLLARFEGAPLIDKYAVYQLLMDYWAETMQDDVYLIAQDGWDAGQKIRQARDGETADFSIKKGRKKVEYVGELIPSSVVVNAYFPEGQQELNELQAAIDVAATRKEEMEEEHTGEEGVLEPLKGTRGVTKGNVQDRVAELKELILELYAPETPEHKQAKTIIRNFTKKPWKKGVQDNDELFSELDILYDWLLAYDNEKRARDAYKEAKSKLYQNVIKRYAGLTQPEIVVLVVEKKWQATLMEAIKAEVERVTSQLANRVQQLEKRYAEPLPDLEAEVAALSATVDGHLQNMGVQW